MILVIVQLTNYTFHIMYAGSLSTGSQVVITAVICSFVFLVIGLLLGILWHHWLSARSRCRVCKSKQSSGESSASAQAVYEDMSSNIHSQVKSDIELKENAAYGHV